MTRIGDNHYLLNKEIEYVIQIIQANKNLFDMFW